MKPQSVVHRLLLIAALLRPAAPSAQPVTSPALDATTIYDRARSVVAARTTPPFLAYTQCMSFKCHVKIQTERSRIVLRMSDRKAFITRIQGSPADRIDMRPVVKDRPLVFPTTSFGLVKRRAGE